MIELHTGADVPANEAGYLEADDAHESFGQIMDYLRANLTKPELRVPPELVDAASTLESMIRERLPSES